MTKRQREKQDREMAKMAEHHKAILRLMREGNRPFQMVGKVDCSRKTIERWYKRFILNGLAIKKRIKGYPNTVLVLDIKDKTKVVNTKPDKALIIKPKGMGIVRGESTTGSVKGAAFSTTSPKSPVSGGKKSEIVKISVDSVEKTILAIEDANTRVRYEMDFANKKGLFDAILKDKGTIVDLGAFFHDAVEINAAMEYLDDRQRNKLDDQFEHIMEQDPKLKRRVEV